MTKRTKKRQKERVVIKKGTAENGTNGTRNRQKRANSRIAEINQEDF